MESRFKLLGHPIHPILVVFPVALFTLGVVLDIGYLVTGNEQFAVAAFWDIGAGIVVGLAAALFGLLDWNAIADGTRAKRIGLWHGAGNAVVVALFAVSWLLRGGDPAYDGLAPFVVALAGAAVATVTVWMGGELVFRLGIGVDEGANPDAPSSLGR